MAIKHNQPDFFKSQDLAKARSRRLIPWFLAGTLWIWISLCLMAMLVENTLRICFGFYINISRELTLDSQGKPPMEFEWVFLQPKLFAFICFGATIIMGLASCFQIRRLGKGGSRVAKMLGGERLHPNPDSIQDRILQNVVAEMSVASGLPVPDVYVLRNEPAINALVAGKQLRDMVVMVTEGAVRHLNRDELQCVIAHEFSHIFNGDTRLNTRLMGWIHGMFSITIFADWMMSNVHGKDAGDIYSDTAVSPVMLVRAVPATIFGFILSFIGFHSALFGKLIQAAVCRQREFLADAAAIQWTRYPTGLIGAFGKIEKQNELFGLHSSFAEVVSHLCFTQTQGTNEAGWFSTHPPLEDRISRVKAMIGGQYDEGILDSNKDLQSDLIPNTKARAPLEEEVFSGLSISGSAISSIGNPGRPELVWCRKLLEKLPPALKEAARSQLNAPILVYSLLISNEVDVRNKQVEGLRNLFPEKEDLNQLTRLHQSIQGIKPGGRVALLELSFPALRRLNREQYAEFQRNLDVLVHADNQLDLFEMATVKLLHRYLDSVKRGINDEPVHHDLTPFRRLVNVLFSCLAHTGRHDPDKTVEVFQLGLGILQGDFSGLKLQQPSEIHIDELDKALEILNRLDTSLKSKVLQAASSMILHDQILTAGEIQLLRMIAACMDCPMPPLIH